MHDIDQTRPPGSEDPGCMDGSDWFNNRRLLEPIGYIPPIEYEMLYYQSNEKPAMVAGLN